MVLLKKNLDKMPIFNLLNLVFFFWSMSDTWNVLVTGGSGFIGSHTILELLKADYQVTAIDNFSNSIASNFFLIL